MGATALAIAATTAACFKQLRRGLHSAGVLVLPNPGLDLGPLKNLATFLRLLITRYNLYIALPTTKPPIIPAINFQFLPRNSSTSVIFLRFSSLDNHSHAVLSTRPVPTSARKSNNFSKIPLTGAKTLTPNFLIVDDSPFPLSTNSSFSVSFFFLTFFFAAIKFPFLSDILLAKSNANCFCISTRIEFVSTNAVTTEPVP